jgi:energy-coupling factor transporter ATP-binding protein EcfA2
MNRHSVKMKIQLENLLNHDMDLVDDSSDQVILFNKGRVVYQGTPYRLFSDQTIIRESALIPPLHYQLMHARKERNFV